MKVVHIFEFQISTLPMFRSIHPVLTVNTVESVTLLLQLDKIIEFLKLSSATKYHNHQVLQFSMYCVVLNDPFFWLKKSPKSLDHMENLNTCNV